MGSSKPVFGTAYLCRNCAQVVMHPNQDRNNVLACPLCKVPGRLRPFPYVLGTEPKPKGGRRGKN